MDLPPEIIDISSGDEGGGDESFGDDDWLTSLLEDGIDDGVGDEVVVVGETGVRKKVVVDDDDDDECLILDGDPEKMVDVGGGGGGVGEDDLLIVGEKGQLACRDYPHPRHLCATFPFSTTPHEKHCNVCHCYVCDSPAPCIYWNLGRPSTDHCNSTDKEGMWKHMRKALKQQNIVRPLPPKISDTTLPVKHTAWDHASRQHPTQTPIPTLSSRSSILRPCPAISSYTGTPATGIHAQTPATSINTRSLATATLTRIPATGTCTRIPAAVAHSRSPAAGILSRISASQRNHIPPVAVAFHGQRPSQQITRPQAVLYGGHNIQREKRCASPLPAHVTQQHSKFRRTQSDVSSNSTRGFGAAPERYEGSRWEYYCPPASLLEQNMKAWQNVLDGVSADLGVSNHSNSSAEAQVTSSSVFSQYTSQINAVQDVGIYAASVPQSTSGYHSGWSNNDTVEQSHAAVVDPVPVTVQPYSPPVSGEIQRELAPAVPGPLPEAGNEPAFVSLEPALVFDFDDDPWHI